MTYAVTGATGQFGSLAIRHLLALGVPPTSVVAWARDLSRASSLTDLGVTVRQADYADPASLPGALSGVDRLLLVSGNAFGQRFIQHKNVLEAARAAGVKLVVYTSVTKADASTNPVAEEHRATEAFLSTLGIPSVVLRNNWYHENFFGDLRGAAATGRLEAAVTQGRVASAARSDLAEAAARVLFSGQGGGQTYELSGRPWTYPEAAAVYGQLAGRPVAFQSVSFEQRLAGLEAAGLPPEWAAFTAAVDRAVDAGALDSSTGDLERLLGRRPTDLAQTLGELLGSKPAR